MEPREAESEAMRAAINACGYRNRAVGVEQQMADGLLAALAAEGWSVARLERAGTWCDGIKQFVPVAQEVECDACVPVWRVAAGEVAGEGE